MSMLRSFAFHELRNLLIVAPYRSRARMPIPYCSPLISTFVHGHGFSVKQGLTTLNLDRREHSKSDINLLEEKNADNNHVQPLVPFSPTPTFPNWSRWAFGSILSLLIPWWKQNWEKLLSLEGEMEKVAEMIENVADVVEMVAGATEKVLAEVAHKLPDDGKLKDTIMMLESVSKEAVKDAHLIKHFIHKVDELKREMETSIEPILEPVTDPGKIPDKECHGK